MKQPYHVLVLEDDENALDGMVELLRGSSYLVTGAATYDGAKQLLAFNTYDLLITDVHLRGFNGLNLVRECHRDRPDMLTIIITGYDEPMMELEAGRYGAQLIRKPVKPDELLKTVEQSLADIHRQRRWPRKRVEGGFRVTVEGRPAAVVDVGYGGLRLEVPTGGQLPDAFDIEIAGIGLHLAVESVWCHRPKEGGPVVCGAALVSDTTPAARTWREIVDRLTA
jgi:CheY-like chemotaxis protein